MKKTGSRVNSKFIEVSLPIEKNPGMDCGALAIQMLMLTDIPEKKDEVLLKKIRKRVQKSLNESTLPGNICKVLKKIGYNVSFFSMIDWRSIANKDFDNWDHRVRELINNDRHALEYPNSINVKKLQDSAKWLISANLISRKKFTIGLLAKFLREGKRVIALVDNGTHYVVIIGIDRENVYYNDPTFEPVKAIKTHDEFMSYWGIAQSMTEAIVVSIL